MVENPVHTAKRNPNELKISLLGFFFEDFRQRFGNLIKNPPIRRGIRGE